MAEHSTIEWTETTWNPIAGCDIVSPGCTNCYAMRRVAPRLAGNPATPHYHGTVKPSKAGPVWTGKIGIASDSVLTKPLRWKRGRMIFVNSTSDLFHEGVPDEVIDKVFAVMALTPHHTFQVLTKRAERMRAYMDRACGRIADTVMAMRRQHGIERGNACAPLPHVTPGRAWWPFPNVWLGVSVEDQKRADERREPLAALAENGWTTFVSYEPALGAVDWAGWEFLSLLISGGESGQGARPSHPDWHCNARDFCAAHDIAFLFKQWGAWVPISEMADTDHLYHPAPEDQPEALRRCRMASACMQSDGKVIPTGEANDFHTVPANAFAGPRPMTMFHIGKRAAGRLLDGVEHNGMPASALERRS